MTPLINQRTESGEKGSDRPATAVAALCIETCYYVVSFSMTQDATGYVCLLIQSTTKEDAGWYTVSARNEAGVVACTCRLDIYGKYCAYLCNYQLYTFHLITPALTFSTVASEHP